LWGKGTKKAPIVIQSEAKNLDNSMLYVHEILPPFGRLDDRYQKKERRFIKTFSLF